MNQSLSYEIADVMPAVQASGLLVSLCTIQQPDGVIEDGGAVSGTWTNITGLVDIPCSGPPLGFRENFMSWEEKKLSETLSMRPLHVLLDGYYGAVSITQPDGTTVTGIQTYFRAVVDGIAYDITGIEHDSQHQMTRMAVTVVAI